MCYWTLKLINEKKIIMKKILLSLVALMFISANAFAGVNVGISGAFTSLLTDGTETTKSSGQKNTGSKLEQVIVPSLFLEFQTEMGIAVGVDLVPGSADLGSGTGRDDDAETAGANKASAELTSHNTIYALVPLGGSGLYVKGGLARATIDTTETLATGTKYGNEDVDGLIFGLGYQADRDNGLFIRAEGTYTDYDSVKFKGSLGGNAAGDSAVRNVIDADIDAIALRVSVGKAF